MAMVLNEADDRRLQTIEQTVKEILTTVNGLVTRQTVTEQRVANLETQPASARSAWTLGFNGCSALAVALSTCISGAALLLGAAGLVVALLKP